MASSAEISGLTAYLQDTRFPATNESFKNVSWVTVSPDGEELYVLQRGPPAVNVWDLQGNLLRSWDTKELGDPHSLRFQKRPDGSYTIWITDMAPPLSAGDGYGHCIKQFSVPGDYLGSLGACGIDTQGTGISPVQFDKVTDVGFQTLGDMWVADGDIHGLNNRLLQIGAGDKVILDLSAPGNQLGSGEKQFHLPHAIDIDPCGRIWVADTLNHRVQVFGPGGNFLQQLNCFGEDGVYGLRVAESPAPGQYQLFITTSPTASPTGGKVWIFDVAPESDAPLPVPGGCTSSAKWSITLPKGSSTAMLHAIDTSNYGQALYIAPLGGDLAPQKWERGNIAGNENDAG